MRVYLHHKELIITMEIALTGSAVTLIQQSLAPIFLIVGIGQMVNVATGRLARIVDRARWFEESAVDKKGDFTSKWIEELVALRRRMRFANWAITFLTASAVLVCIDVILLLLNGMLVMDFNTAIITMFIMSLTMLTCGLGAFFFEVSIATASLKIDPNYFKK